MSHGEARGAPNCGAGYCSCCQRMEEQLIQAFVWVGPGTRDSEIILALISTGSWRSHHRARASFFELGFHCNKCWNGGYILR